MQRLVQITGDGSPTIAIPDMQITYRSKYGAMQESRHVFIEAGLQPLLQQKKLLNIFEMGFGSGLNALLTLQQAIIHQQHIFYYAIDAFPLIQDEVAQLHYSTVIKNNFFSQLHSCAWNEAVEINNYFMLYKSNAAVQKFSSNTLFHLIYFDAFAPAIQPELWTQKMFEKLYDMLAKNGVLVTYCSKGEVRRNMLAAGFIAEKLKGPPGKREMLRAIKH